MEEQPTAIEQTMEDTLENTPALWRIVSTMVNYTQVYATCALKSPHEILYNNKKQLANCVKRSQISSTETFMNDPIIITIMENKPLQLETMIKKNIDLSKIDLYRPEYEFVTPVGRIDILAEDEDFNPVVVEVKIGTAGDSALGQIFGYMQSVNASRGVILANGFTKRLVLSARSLNIELIQYELDIKISGKSVKKDMDHLCADETTDERTARLFMLEVGKLQVADNKESFVQDSDATYIEDNVLLVKSATVVDIAERMKLFYGLEKLRIVLNSYVLKSTEHRMFLRKRISVWFFKKPTTDGDGR